MNGESDASVEERVSKVGTFGLRDVAFPGFPGKERNDEFEEEVYLVNSCWLPDSAARH